MILRNKFFGPNVEKLLLLVPLANHAPPHLKIGRDFITTTKTVGHLFFWTKEFLNSLLQSHTFTLNGFVNDPGQPQTRRLDETPVHLREEPR
jgi:hypothetical protein